MLCITFFYTLTYEYVGKIQKKEKKTKHIYIADSHTITYRKKHTIVPFSLFTCKKNNKG